MAEMLRIRTSRGESAYIAIEGGKLIGAWPGNDALSVPVKFRRKALQCPTLNVTVRQFAAARKGKT